MIDSAIHTRHRGSTERLRSRRERTFERRRATEEPQARATERRAGPIVVGVDGRKRSKDALALAARLAERTGGELLLVHAHGYGPLEKIIGEDGYHALVRTSFTASFYQVKGILGERYAREMRAIPDASPAAGLQRIAESEGAQTIVVGPSRRSGLGRFRPGSVSERLLWGATVPIAIAPAGYARRERLLARVVCAFDGSPESRLALNWAEELTRQSDADLMVYSVHSPPTFGDLGVEGLFSRESASQALRSELEREQREALIGRNARGLVMSGDPARTLARATKNADLLVVGSRGYGPVRAALPGGVSQYVIRHASCPVVVCPRGAELPEAPGERSSHPMSGTGVRSTMEA
jgi:nucleotide-binding universal stress UspA family protein